MDEEAVGPSEDESAALLAAALLNSVELYDAGEWSPGEDVDVDDEFIAIAASLAQLVLGVDLE